MKTLTQHTRPVPRQIKKRRIAVVSAPQNLRQERRRAAQSLLAACVAVLFLAILLLLLIPIFTREKVITVDMSGRVSITDHADKYTRVLE